MTTHPAAVEAAFSAHIAAHLAKDQDMHREIGYAPTATVIVQRELHRQADEVRQIGESIRADFWQEWTSGRGRVAHLHVGFRDNRNKDAYCADIVRLEAALRPHGYKLTILGNFAACMVMLNRDLASQVQARHADWLARMAA